MPSNRLFVPTSPEGKQIAHLLHTENIIWLTVTRSNDSPFPYAVWFLWEAEQDSILMYSHPEAKKFTHLRHNPLVSLHLNCTHHGTNVIIMQAKVSLDDDIPAITANAAYIAKYQYAMKTLLNMSPDQFGSSFAQGYRAQLTSIKKWH